MAFFVGAAMPWTDATTIKKRLAGILKKEPEDLDQFWDEIVSDSRTRGYNEVVSRLTNRGFTISQINSWDRRVEFERDIALFWSLVTGGALGDSNDKYIKLFDRRAELDTVNVTTSGEEESVTTGRIGHGDLDDDRQTFKRYVGPDGSVEEVRW